MKKSILTSLFAMGFAFCFAQGKLAFETTTHDFGDVKETGGPAAFEFKFKNTGDQPIIISNVQASCGCTTPDWTKTPVAPGQSGFIKAQYNPLGRPGQFNKSLTVTSNSIEPSTVVFIKGNVVPDATPTTAAPADGSKPVVAPGVPVPGNEPLPASEPTAKPKAAVKKPADKGNAGKKPAAKKPAAKKKPAESK